MTDSKTLLSLTHEPFGRKHPYKQDATERFPRDPISGQPVMLGIVTRPAGTAEAVWVDLLVEGTGNRYQLPAVTTEETDEQTLWRVQLPPFKAGDHVNYSLGARQGERKLKSEKFTFDVMYWLSPSRVVDYICAADRCLILFVDQDLERTFSLVVTFRDPGLLHFQWMSASDKLSSRQISKAEEQSYKVLAVTDARIHLATERCHLLIHRYPSA